MRATVDAEKLQRFMVELGAAAQGPRAEAFEAIAALKEDLDINVELASPDHFVPPVPGWRERSAHVGGYGRVDFHHFDFLSQALAKLARGHERDLADVRAMLERRFFTAADLTRALAEIEPELVRYPGLDAAAFRERGRAFAERAGG